MEDINKMKKVFFVGINGIGMSALAKIMINEGYQVFGSDISRKEITEQLEAMGAKIYSSHIDLNVNGMDMVVYTSAVKASNPELVFAKLNNIEILQRGELLAMLLNCKKGIAVAGTHGKTTTSSMLGVAMLGLDPTIVVGGVIPEIGSNSRSGKGEYLIAEADESDNSFLYMRPRYSIITNVEADHLDHHGTYENIKKSFAKFIEQTEEKVIICKDCCNLYDLKMDKEKIIRYSVTSEDAEIYATNIRMENKKSIYNVIMEGNDLGEFVLTIPGMHNISNSLGVIYLAKKLGADMNDVKVAIEAFKGAKRRFDIVYENGITVVDDYAHHPTEIKATLNAAKQRAKGKVIALFQPHRYSRISSLLEDFKGCFVDADEIVLFPIYSAGEKNTFGITSEILAEKIEGKKKITVISGGDEAVEMVLNREKDGSLYMFMGAGDIYKSAYKIKEELEKR